MYIHPRSVNDRVFEVFRSPGRFTKNPDVVQLPTGRLLLVYSDNDAHWAQETQILTILRSDDQGLTWAKHAVVDQADLRKGEERLVTPRLSALPDGRLAVIVDHDDFGHFHEDQACGNWIYWSEDGGLTWSGPHDYGIGGFEPDRITVLPEGSLAVVSHTMRRDSQEFCVILTVSEDNGRTWTQRAEVAHDGYHRFCEGALVLLEGGVLACLLRENHSAGLPSFVCFSHDGGYNWSEPLRCPFALHRPYGKRLADGRVLVTGRHVNGGLGTYAWCGDLQREAGTWSIGGPHTDCDVSLDGEALRIQNGPGRACAYTLYPPEGSDSEILLEAKVRVRGEAGKPVAFLSLSNLMNGAQGAVLYILPEGITLNRQDVDFRKSVDMTAWHTLTMRHDHGLLTVAVDGKVLIQQCVYRDNQRPSDFNSYRPGCRTMFGSVYEQGLAEFARVCYRVRNATKPAINWRWDPSMGLPDAYQRARLLQLHGNAVRPDGWPDHGYSSHLTLPDGRILVVDYTNLGDPLHKSHLVGVIVDPAEL